MAKSAKPKGTRKDSTLEKDAWALHEALSELVRLYQFRDRTRICCYDVSVTQCYALHALILNGSMALNSLAGELYLDKSTASRVVDSLERKGYVRRKTDPHDGRALRLEVTGQGRALFSRIEQDIVEEVKELVSDIEPKVRKSTIRLVARLAWATADRFARLKLRGGCSRG